MFFATNNVLYSGDTISPAGTGNTLLLQGAGTFNLAAPTTLSNIQTVDVENALAGQSQVIDLRSGLNVTLNVLDSATVTIVGATDNDIINLGSGAATVTLCSASETVNGGSGAETFYVTAATIGATIAGGSGANTLRVQGGGVATMGSNITGVQTVDLDNSANYTFTANTLAGLTVRAGTGIDTITIGAASQKVFGSTGTLNVIATAAQGGVEVYGAASKTATTLDILTAGTVALNASDNDMTVQLAAADTLTLSVNTSIAVQRRRRRRYADHRQRRAARRPHDRTRRRDQHVGARRRRCRSTCHHRRRCRTSRPWTSRAPPPARAGPSLCAPG